MKLIYMHSAVFAHQYYCIKCLNQTKVIDIDTGNSKHLIRDLFSQFSIIEMCWIGGKVVCVKSLEIIFLSFLGNISFAVLNLNNKRVKANYLGRVLKHLSTNILCLNLLQTIYTICYRPYIQTVIDHIYKCKSYIHTLQPSHVYVCLVVYRCKRVHTLQPSLVYVCLVIYRCILVHTLQPSLVYVCLVVYRCILVHTLQPSRVYVCLVVYKCILVHTLQPSLVYVCLVVYRCILVHTLQPSFVYVCLVVYRCILVHTLQPSHVYVCLVVYRCILVHTLQPSHLYVCLVVYKCILVHTIQPSLLYVCLMVYRCILVHRLQPSRVCVCIVVYRCTLEQSEHTSYCQVYSTIHPLCFFSVTLEVCLMHTQLIKVGAQKYCLNSFLSFVSQCCTLSCETINHILLYTFNFW